MDIVKKIAAELEIRPQQVEAVIKLIDEGNTIPFIARYRKEAHGSLNDEQLRNLSERLTYLRTLEEKKEGVPWQRFWSLILKMKSVCVRLARRCPRPHEFRF